MSTTYSSLLTFLAGGAIVGTLAALHLRRTIFDLNTKKETAIKSAVAAVKEKNIHGATTSITSNTQSVAGYTVVVTGASSGIGRAIAKAFHDAGANVAVGARRLERLEALCCELDPSSNGTALPVKTDVTSAESVKNLVSQAEAKFGRGCDIIVNVAGVMYFTMMKNCKTDEWDKTVDVNCKGVLNGFGAVLDGMVKRGKGHIITISSDAGRRVFPKLAVYCASKYFVEALSEATRRELVGTGLRVTTIQPGDCATDLVQNNTDKEALDSLGIKAGAVVGEGWANDWNMLQPADVAASVMYAATAPAHVAINEVLIEPRDQE
jgi:NADP-dependent 3-hydroxy acid dehydrogenase YdfG